MWDLPHAACINAVGTKKVPTVQKCTLQLGGLSGLAENAAGSLREI